MLNESFYEKHAVFLLFQYHVHLLSFLISSFISPLLSPPAILPSPVSLTASQNVNFLLPIGIQSNSPKSHHQKRVESVRSAFGLSAPPPTESLLISVATVLTGNIYQKLGNCGQIKCHSVEIPEKYSRRQAKQLAHI